MAKARAGKQSAKKKKWVKIVSPKFLGERELGETYLEEVSSAMGKTVSINLMKVTGDIKTQNCTVKFVVYETKDGLLRTKIVSYTYLPSSIKRMVRRRMNRVDDSIVVRTKDNVRIRIKPMLLTHGKASKSIEYALRAGMKQELISRIKKMNYEELFSSVIKNNIQMDIKSKLNTTHPIRMILIRALQLEKRETVKDTEVGKVKVSKKALSKQKEAEEKKPKKKEPSEDKPEEKEDKKPGKKQEKKKEEKDEEKPAKEDKPKKAKAKPKK